MYLHRLFLILALISSLWANAQKEASHFHFGDRLHFKITKDSFEFFTDSKMFAYEGSASISDSLGNLLFYTNGETVWDNTNKPMPNGKGLNVYPSATQATLIVKKPGTNPHYYIIQATNYRGYFYSVVDISLNNGRGDIIEKNKVLYPEAVSEKLTAVNHRNGKDIWLAGHTEKGDTFITFLLTENGFTTQLLSIIGNYNNSFLGYGQLKFSPNGKFLANANGSGFKGELYCFNNETGKICNYIDLFKDILVRGGFYGCEFSADSKKLYFHKFNSHPYQIVQLNIDTPYYEIPNTLKVFPTDANSGLQLALDGSIYMTSYSNIGGGKLLKITNPEKDYPYFGIDTPIYELQTPFSTQLTLTGFNQSYFNTDSINTPSNCDCNTTIWEDTFNRKAPVYPFYMPNALSPNGDGLNDYLTFYQYFDDLIYGDEGPLSYFRFQLYNRWGQCLYESAEYMKKTFEGKDKNGNDLPDGIYFYILEYQFYGNEMQRMSGSLQILR